MIDRYGDFELTKFLTAGGMADLYLAKSRRYQGQLVIKRLQSRYLEMPRMVEMFIDEGRIARALRHPNIVKIFDVGQVDGSYFIAMEYIAGRDLLSICRRGIEVGHALPRHLAAAISAQAALGLSHAHERVDERGRPLRVVHCDLSPGNIVVSWRGTAKIVDFGIARAALQLRAEDQNVAGKYNYMAPEQIRGEAIDARADLFALGVILYELTVGKPLFSGRPEQVMRLVLEEPILQPSQIRPDYPKALEEVVMRALERDPARRTASARELHAGLEAWLKSTGELYGKREIANYLRAAFGTSGEYDADELRAEEEDPEPSPPSAAVVPAPLGMAAAQPAPAHTRRRLVELLLFGAALFLGLVLYLLLRR
jgi:serine/threonine protein kinase